MTECVPLPAHVKRRLNAPAPLVVIPRSAPPMIGLAGQCPRDYEEWGETNRLTLFKERVQRWVVATSVNETDSDELIASQCRAFMQFIFSRGIPVFGRDIGAATDFKVLSVSREQPGTPDANQRREELDPMPFLKPGPVAFCVLEFAWRGPGASIPWPSVRVVGTRLFGINQMCPDDANFLVMATKNLGAAPERKLDERPIGERFLDELLPSGTEVAAAAIMATTLAVLALVFVKPWGIGR